MRAGDESRERGGSGSARGLERHVGAAYTSVCVLQEHIHVFTLGTAGGGRWQLSPSHPEERAVLCGARRAAVAEGSGGP